MQTGADPTPRKSRSIRSKVPKSQSALAAAPTVAISPKLAIRAVKSPLATQSEECMAMHGSLSSCLPSGCRCLPGLRHAEGRWVPRLRKALRCSRPGRRRSPRRTCRIVVRSFITFQGSHSSRKDTPAIGGPPTLQQRFFDIVPSKAEPDRFPVEFSATSCSSTEFRANMVYIPLPPTTTRICIYLDAPFKASCKLDPETLVRTSSRRTM